MLRELIDDVFWRLVPATLAASYVQISLEVLWRALPVP